MLYWTNDRQRTGFTILETVMALGIFMLALVMTAQLGAWSILERARMQMRLEAAEAAANVLEAARSLDWQQLGPDWALKQKVADYASARLADAQLVVHVLNETSRVKRVDVEIQWPQSGRPVLRPVRLSAYFGNRASRPAGGKP
jgi:type II secretory pathway pseudopilin PulG